ncbi:MAG TPA: MaoC/PaaZ C-terminal domain-containing protein [Candidatus Limnocylindrales bacterium]|nr:MaoC/PaaZ C-terminal domain-containing protein [Candidatus Limnocylindrales bacterium]
MPRFEDIKEGDELPELRKKPTLQTLVKYSAGSGDFNPLHHDYNFPQARQIGSIIVHGRFKYASLGELVSNWVGHAGRIRKLSCQYRGMDLPDKEFVCRGVVKKKSEDGGEKVVDLEIWAENAEGKKTTPGAATVVFA